MSQGRRVLVDFVFWSSSAGLPNVGRARTKCLAWCWSVVWLLCLICFIVQMRMIITNYLSYKVVVKTQLVFKPMRFPAVTICSQNPYKASKIEKYPELKELSDMYLEASNRTLNPNNDKYYFLMSRYSMERVERALRAMRYLVAAQPEDVLDDITHEFDDLVRTCSFGSAACGAHNFTAMFDPIYGRCFTFNSDTSSSRAGPAYGLRLFIVANASENMAISDSAGVRVAVSAPGEAIFPDSFGHNAGIGFSTSFGIKYMESTRLPYPYSNCTRRKDHQTYSQEACFRECTQKHVAAHCACQDPQSTFSSALNVSYCNYTQLDCVTAVSKANEHTFDVGTCKCPPLCHEITYETEVSMSLWPSDAYMATLCSTAPPDMDCRQYAANTLFIEIYYEQLNYLSHVERAYYTVECLLADIGGDVGLWLGISAISMLEFLFLPGLFTWGVCTKRASPHTPITAYYERDHNIFDKIGGGNIDTENMAPTARRHSFFPSVYVEQSPQNMQKPPIALAY